MTTLCSRSTPSAPGQTARTLPTQLRVSPGDADITHGFGPQPWLCGKVLCEILVFAFGPHWQKWKARTIPSTSMQALLFSRSDRRHRPCAEPGWAEGTYCQQGKRGASSRGR